MRCTPNVCLVVAKLSLVPARQFAEDTERWLLREMRRLTVATVTPTRTTLARPPATRHYPAAGNAARHPFLTPS